MNTNLQKDYPLISNLLEEDLDENSSLKKMLRLVGKNKRVIDFGCATGYFAQLLTQNGCEVTGIEVNVEAAKAAEQYCKKVIVADLDFISLIDILPNQEFDVAIFGDVLEHLRNPWKLLAETRQFLKPEGYVVASIPNIAHGAIRLSLLQGRFDYVELGILDNTHLRFFTIKTVEELFKNSGYFIEAVERTKIPMFSGSSWIPYIDKNSFDSQLIETIQQEEDADTLQFVLVAFPLTLEGKYNSLEKQHHQLINQLKKYNIQIQQMQESLLETETNLQNKEAELQTAQIELDKYQFELQQIQTELEECQSQLQDTEAELEEYQSQLQQVQLAWHQTQTKLQQAHQGWEYCQNLVKSMESSKFWKLRQAWFKVKQFIRLNPN